MSNTEDLRKNTPYLIRWDNDKNYYVLNRDYEYIGLNTRYIEHKKQGEAYLFDGKSQPYIFDERNASYLNYFMEMCNEYKKQIKINSLNKCLNSNKFTEEIMKL